MTTSRTVPEEEPTAPDLEEMVRRGVEAVNRREYDRAMTLYAPNVVWDGPPARGFAIRGFSEDWWGAYDEYRARTEEISDLGDGVGFVVVVVRGRLRGSTAWVQFRWGSVVTWIDGMIERATNYFDIAEARAAAERLAEERG
jgi:ketosteroid isomerase-like protein